MRTLVWEVSSQMLELRPRVEYPVGMLGTQMLLSVCRTPWLPIPWLGTLAQLSLGVPHHQALLACRSAAGGGELGASAMSVSPLSPPNG